MHFFAFTLRPSNLKLELFRSDEELPLEPQCFLTIAIKDIPVPGNFITHARYFGSLARTLLETLKIFDA